MLRGKERETERKRELNWLSFLMHKISIEMIIMKEESKKVRDIIMFVSALYIFFFFLLFSKGRELLKIMVVAKVGCYLKDNLILLI